MRRSKLKPSTEESFAVGKLVGHKEAFEEVLEMIKSGGTIQSLDIYCNARLKSIVSSNLNDPFKQKEPSRGEVRSKN